jgi:hypothetical protein
MGKLLFRHRVFFGLMIVSTSSGLPSLAGTEVTATKSLTVQPTGPRQGEAGSRYFNVEGQKNDRYARFGVLVFELPKGQGRDSEVENLSLRLVQSVPRFARDGKIHFLLAEPSERGADSLAALTFDVKSPDGLGRDAFRAVHRLGSEIFTRVKTGQADRFDLIPGGGRPVRPARPAPGRRDHPDRRRAR